MVTREQLVADVNAAQANVDAAHEVLWKAESALYEYDVAEFSKATGLNIGDKLLINENLRRLLWARQWAEFIIERWAIGTEIKIVGINPNNSTFAVGSGVTTGDTGGINLDMVKQMRTAWLAQHEVAI